MKYYHYFRPRQIMSPGDFEWAFWHVEDGELKTWREPLVGWALGDDWSCPQADCMWRDCVNIEYHQDVTREVKPLTLADDVVLTDDDMGNGFLISKTWTDAEVGARARQEHKWREEAGAIRAAAKENGHEAH